MPKSTASKKSVISSLVEQRYSYLFIAPAIILFSVFVLVPVVSSFFLSFTKYNALSAPRWVGLANYYEIFFKDPRFWKALGNTAIYVLGVVPVGISISLLLAVAIYQKIRFKNFFKAIFFMPAVTSVVAVSIIWRWLFAGEKYGLINYALMKFGIAPVDWLMSPFWTLPAIMIMSIWAGVGYNMILILAGLQTIPQTLYEAAEIDGAGAWHKFWHITLPLLKPTLLFAVIMSMISSFQLFEQVYIMTAGTGEGVGGVLDCALSLVAYLYEKGFQRFEMGYASAIAYILFAIILAATFINMKVIRSKFEY
ncbi:MAG: sugar ABC transporter permease [Candidatus Omnitrophica bacterium]|nr:sugar ABC transporter permease [Candidatus Omnitrophota bacterium]